MIQIINNVLKKQNNFWNQCLFHPTDAIEYHWGRRILDKIAADGAIKTVRIYTMFEDIVYTDENSRLCYDFRLSDLRLDYMVEKGYPLPLTYAGMPDVLPHPPPGGPVFPRTKPATREKCGTPLGRNLPYIHKTYRGTLRAGNCVRMAAPVLQ